jgi:hypothetical protein
MADGLEFDVLAQLDAFPNHADQHR